jgi:cytochrome c553
MAAKAKATRKPPMTAKYAALPKDDIDALVAYLSSLKKK